MTPNSARSEIARLVATLLGTGLAISANTPVIYRDGTIVRVTWPSSRNAAGLFSSNPSSTLLEYRRFLLDNHYICLMRDGGMIQISFDFENNSLSGHRMCFFPCPVLLPVGLRVEDIDEIDLLLVEELQRHIEIIDGESRSTDVNLRLASPIRFDYAPRSPSDPASHVHLSGAEARVPVISALSVGHFVQFVLRHFYPDVWSDNSLRQLTRWPISLGDRCIDNDDEFELHLSCRYPL
jgi:hypothetical protein